MESEALWNSRVPLKRERVMFEGNVTFVVLSWDGSCTIGSVGNVGVFGGSGWDGVEGSLGSFGGCD
jgi:hypothetical protein